MDRPTERRGTQSLERGILLLRTVATRPQFGWRLSDLAAACDLDKGTAHRMLACLVAERLVAQRPGDRHYLPGPLLYELGLALPERAQFQRAAEPHLRALVRHMGGVAFLLLRSGSDYVCCLRTGSQPLTALMVYPGTRRPLFTSVGGVAMLQTLPAGEAQAIVADNTRREIARQGTKRLAALAQMRERSARHGFGVNLGDVVPGLHAFAVAVPGVDGALAALCLAGPADLYPPSRLGEIRGALEASGATLAAEAQKFDM